MALVRAAAHIFGAGGARVVAVNVTVVFSVCVGESPIFSPPLRAAHRCPPARGEWTCSMLQRHAWGKVPYPLALAGVEAVASVLQNGEEMMSMGSSC